LDAVFDGLSRDGARALISAADPFLVPPTLPACADAVIE